MPRDAIGQEAFAVIRDAMGRENVAGLARVVLSSRERPMLVAVMGNGLCGVTLRFAHEVRKQAEYFSMIPEMKLPAEMVKLAQHIIETKSAAFDPATLEDHYRNALVRILRKKQAKMPAPPAPVAPSRENVINLMDALRRSIAAEPPAKKPAAASKAARANSTLADLLTPLLVANPFLAIRATLLWWLGDKFEYGLPHGWQSWLRRWTVDSFFPVSLF